MRLNENLSGIRLPNADDFASKNLTFLVLFEEERTNDVYDLPLTYSLETGVVRCEDAHGVLTISLRDNEELSKLWEPMTPERFTALMATLQPAFTRETDRYHRCLLNISPEGQILKSDSDEDLRFTSLAYFPVSIDDDENEGWHYWDTLAGGSGTDIRASIVPDVDSGRLAEVASQPTLADFGWKAAWIHRAVQRRHPMSAEFINRIFGIETAKGIGPPYTEHIQQTAVYLREKLGVDSHPYDWTPAQWASANNARLASRLHAQKADFPPEQAAAAVHALTAAVKHQRSQRPPFMTAATINPQGLSTTHQSQRSPRRGI